MEGRKREGEEGRKREVGGGRKRWRGGENMECKDLCGRGGDGVGGGKDMGEGGVERKVQEPCAGGEGERDGYGGGRRSGTEGTRTLCRRGGGEGWIWGREEEWNGRYKNPVQEGRGGGKDMGEGGGVERKVQEPCAGGEGERDGYGGGRRSGTEGTRTLCRRGGWSEEREGYGGGQWNGRYKRRGGDGVRRDMEEWNGRYKNPVQEGRDGVRRGKDMGEGGGSGTDGP